MKKLLIILFTIILVGCAAPKPMIFIPQQAPAIAKAPPPRIVLVLGGGGARGLAHLGVLKVLQQNRIPIDMIVAADSGSIVGALYADNPSIPQIRNTLLNAEPSQLIDISALHLLEGPVTGNALQNFMLAHVRARNFEQLRTRLVTTALDIRTGQTITLASGPIAPAVNASCALPPYFHPVKLYGHTLVDGAITDPVPVDVAKTFNPKIIIAVNLAATLPSDMPTSNVGVYDRSMLISDEQFSSFSDEAANVIIHPAVADVSTPNRQQRFALIQAGENAALKALPKICAILQKNYIASACSNDIHPMPLKPLSKKKILESKIMHFIKLKPSSTVSH